MQRFARMQERAAVEMPTARMPKQLGRSYAANLRAELQIRNKRRNVPIALDLFAGCGGFALGFEAAGFSTVGFELDKDCCTSYRQNLGSPCHQQRLVVGQELVSGASVIIAGPPCQP